jgi:hypothetical protein
MSPAEFESHNPRKRAAADPRLRRRGYWNGPAVSRYCHQNIYCIFCYFLPRRTAQAYHNAKIMMLSI